MTKENTKYIRTRIQENTESNLSKILELLTDVYTDELYYNHKLSDATHEMRMEVVRILQECYKKENKFKSVLDD